MTDSPLTLAPQTEILSQYEALQADIEIARQEDAQVSFDYRDLRDNKAARSHVYKLRKLRASIDRARKDAKAYALDLGRRVDAAANVLTKQVEEIIEPHQLALDAIEQEEKDRQARHAAVIEKIVAARVVPVGTPSAEIRSRLEFAQAYDVSQLEEFQDQARGELAQTILQLQQALEATERAEAQEAELAALRREKGALEKAAAAAAAAAPPEAARPTYERPEAAAQAMEAAPLQLPVAPASEGLTPAQERLRQEIAKVIHLQGLSVEGVALAIVTNRLHPALRVDWASLVPAEPVATAS